MAIPGAKPGTHLGPERIRQRLHELGIRPETARPGALLALDEVEIGDAASVEPFVHTLQRSLVSSSLLRTG